MTTDNKTALLLCLAALVLVSGCSRDPGESISEAAASISDGVFSDDFYNHLYYPHPEGWVEASSHGLTVLASASGNDDCLVCHDEDSTDPGDSETPAGCKSCHGTYPHVVSWRDKLAHGQYALANGSGECAGQCHGTDLEGGLSSVSCNGCHETYPHDPATWKEKEEHGATALLSGTSACTSCHGEDLTGGDSGVGCKQCHELYPHDAESWVEKDYHGKTAIEEGLAACRGCHGEELTGGDTGVACDSCHAAYPHDGNWKEAANHGPASAGNAKRLCTGCHGEELTGADTDTGCYDCHAVYPHDNVTVPWSVALAWGDKEAHGNHVSENGSAECSGACHGDDLTGGLSGVSCLSGCHNVSYPHPAGWTDTALLGTDDFHGSVGQGSGKTLCMTCHGEELTGGTSEVSCFTCHENYPHVEETWVADGMENLHATTFIGLARTGEEEKCSACHGENYDRKTGGITCTNCHSLGVTHTGAWLEGTGHGAFFSSHFASDDGDQYCQDCHGAPVVFTDDHDLDETGICFNCHFLEDRSSSQTKESLASASDCYSCHWAYPHVGYEAGSGNANAIATAWGESVGDLTGEEDEFYYGHVFYQTRNPNFTDGDGDEIVNDPMFYDFADGADPSAAIANTCGGGTSGSCHYEGAKSEVNALAEGDLCGVYCHTE